MSYLAEQNVIGALLMEPEAVSQVCQTLKPEMFTGAFLGRVYVEFLRAYDNRYFIDITVLMTKLADYELPGDLMLSELKSCMDATTTSATVKYHAKIVFNDYKAQMVSELLKRIVPDGNVIDQQIGELLNSLEALRDSERTTAKHMAVIVKENKDKYFKENESGKINLGFSETDDRLGGIEGGDVIIIGARPAVGKSALVTQMTVSLTGQGKRVGFYNLEMQEKQMYERFVVGQSGIGLTRLRRAQRFLGDEKERFDRANDFLRKQNLYISTGSKSVSDIRNEVKNMEYDVLIIDYLQLLKSEVFYRNRVSEVGDISKSIKAMAMDFNIPVILLSQLNRASEMRDTKEPTMSELREAGDIEQDASIVLLMWNYNEDRAIKGFKIEKNRQGEFGTSYLKFDGDKMKFSETQDPMAGGFRRIYGQTPFD